MGDFADARQKMVEGQLRTSDILDHDVLAAMGSVPREAFVPGSLAALAYLDEDLPVAGSAGRRFLMRPATLGKLLQLAEIRPTDGVLVVGCPTGYEAAVAARIARDVVALESDPELARAAAEQLAALGVDTAEVVSGPLPAGWPGGAPYDVIVVAGAVECGIGALAEQLAVGGRMVVVEGLGGAAAATLYTRSAGGVSGRFAFNASARLLPGFERPKTFVF
jgi:protein-L-isoaspartate(D-aspartate) O-methyltransferase